MGGWVCSRDKELFSIFLEKYNGIPPNSLERKINSLSDVLGKKSFRLNKFIAFVLQSSVAKILLSTDKKFLQKW